MTKVVVTDYVNIDILPLTDNLSGISDISIGDLHGNAIKLLYFLVRQGICTISSKDYEQLVDIYRNPNLTHTHLAEFNAIVASMEIINHDILVRLLGDELGDRGSNDYFVLKILQKLVKEHVKLEILLSNHGIEFIEAYERYAERGNVFKGTLLNPFIHAKSLAALANIISKGLITANDVINIVNTSYKPLLKIISYSLDTKTDGITIYTHAAIGLKSIRALAKKFNVVYKDKTSIELAITIDLINQYFAPYVHENSVHELYASNEMQKGYGTCIPFHEDNVLEFILWNRTYSSLERPANHQGYALSFVHGHDKEAITNNIYGLDSDVGKAPALHTELYISLASDETQRILRADDKKLD